MTEMVERVARAISDHDVDCQERGGWQNCDRPQPCSCRLSARAAIAAMREPTQKMLDAAKINNPDDPADPNGECEAIVRYVWRSMIIEALGQWVVIPARESLPEGTKV